MHSQTEFGNEEKVWERVTVSEFGNEEKLLSQSQSLGTREKFIQLQYQFHQMHLVH